MLLVEAAAFVARRRDATRREAALVLAHAPALPALCLLPDGSTAQPEPEPQTRTQTPTLTPTLTPTPTLTLTLTPAQPQPEP